MSPKKKFYSFTIDIIHNIIVFSLYLLTFYLFFIMIFYWKYDLPLTILLNIFVSILILQFFIFKRCSVQLLYNKIAGLNVGFNNGFFWRASVNYISENKPYINEKKENSSKFLFDFMNTHSKTTGLLIILLIIING